VGLQSTKLCVDYKVEKKVGIASIELESGEASIACL
jgi:hypothetical protein